MTLEVNGARTAQGCQAQMGSSYQRSLLIFVRFLPSLSCEASGGTNTTEKSGSHACFSKISGWRKGIERLSLWVDLVGHMARVFGMNEIKFLPQVDADNVGASN